MKGQGLGISAVILIALGLIVLVLVIVFVILPITRFSPPPASNYNLTEFQHTCQVDCGIATQDSPSATQFCQATAYINGQILHCYSQFLPNQYVYDNGQCVYIAKNGTQMTADSSTCV
ncbi:MAG: hypothetical protein ACP5TF_01975 [Candidatus Acidifodinimicrobium sp.]